MPPRRLVPACVACLAPLLLGSASPTPVAPGEHAFLRTETERITLPWVAADELVAAHGVPRGGGPRTSIAVDVAPPLAGRGWELTVRTESAGGPSVAARPPRVFWKLGSAPPSDFRPLREEEQLVMRSETATSGRITIDVVFGVDWNVTPGRHDVGFLFELEPL